MSWSHGLEILGVHIIVFAKKDAPRLAEPFIFGGGIAEVIMTGLNYLGGGVGEGKGFGFIIGSVPMHGSNPLGPPFFWLRIGPCVHVYAYAGLTGGQTGIMTQSLHLLESAKNEARGFFLVFTVVVVVYVLRKGIWKRWQGNHTSFEDMQHRI